MIREGKASAGFLCACLLMTFLIDGLRLPVYSQSSQDDQSGSSGSRITAAPRRDSSANGSASSGLTTRPANPGRTSATSTGSAPSSSPLLSPSSKRLSAGVTHSEFLAPVALTQRPGQVYRPLAAAKRNVPKAKKFLIPAWLAGTWQRAQVREVSRVELPSGKKLTPAGVSMARVRDKFGSYQDSEGKIWQIFWPSRSSGEIDRGNVIDVHHVQDYNLSIINPKTVVVEVQAIHTVVGKGNRRIISVYQDEELNKYSLTGADGLATDSSVKVFDHQGRPIYLTRTVSSESRIAPFSLPSRTQVK